MDPAATRMTAGELLELYESGKHRRYSLLFAVNGGAFAIVKLRAESPGGSGEVLGGLTLPALAAGMALFTLLLVADVYLFGEKMRRAVEAERAVPRELRVFGPPGKAVLLSLGALIALGWLLAGFGRGA